LWRDYQDAVADRTCRLFTLLGPAGIGKSRLVADFLERLADSADVLRGRCLSYGESITYWPLVEMLTPLAIDPETIVASTPEETRVAFRRLLESRTAERPQVVVVDDLQWAEPIFVDLIEHVADLSRNAPIFLLCVARTEFLETWPDWAGGKLNATSLLLEPLEDEETETLITRLLRNEAIDDALRERITVASAGNPLYVEEMLAMVREPGTAGVTVPPSIQALLQARIDSLEADTRTVVECGAVEGEVFHRGAVVELVPAQLRPTVDEQLASLVRRELIRPEASFIPREEGFRFRHILVRDAAYDAMPKELRATLHEKFSGWLERAETPSTFEQDEILGYHLEQAVKLKADLGRIGEAELKVAKLAGRRLVTAGRGALGRGDQSAAAGLLQRGVDLLPVDDPIRLEALPDLALARIRRGELEEAETILRAAIAESREAGSPSVEVHARITLSRVRTRVDSDARVEDELREALEIAGSLDPSDLPNLARVNTEIGSCRFMLGRAADGEIDLENAAAYARRARNNQLERAALISRLRPIAWGPTPADDGIAFCDVLIESDLTTQADKSSALQVRALFQAMRGDFEGARRSATRAWELIEEFGLRLQKGLYAIDVGFAELLSTDLARAEDVLRQGHELLLEIGDIGVRSSVDGILCEVLYRRGRDDEALELAEEARAIASPDDLDSQPRWRVGAARVLSRRGAHAEALELVREAVGLVEPIDFLGLKAYVHDVLGEVVARMGQTDEAAAAFARAISFHEEKGNVVSAERSREALDGLRSSTPPS
jgi:tetratricopeptide (TPR) repeat protein